MTCYFLLDEIHQRCTFIYWLALFALCGERMEWRWWWWCKCCSPWTCSAVGRWHKVTLSKFRSPWLFSLFPFAAAARSKVASSNDSLTAKNYFHPCTTHARFNSFGGGQRQQSRRQPIWLLYARIKKITCNSLLTCLLIILQIFSLSLKLPLTSTTG